MTNLPLRSSLPSRFHVPENAPSRPPSRDGRKACTVWPRTSRVTVTQRSWKLFQPRLCRSYMNRFTTDWRDVRSNGSAALLEAHCWFVLVQELTHRLVVGGERCAA